MTGLQGKLGDIERLYRRPPAFIRCFTVLLTACSYGLQSSNSSDVNVAYVVTKHRCIFETYAMSCLVAVTEPFSRSLALQ